MCFVVGNSACDKHKQTTGGQKLTPIQENSWRSFVTSVVHVSNKKHFSLTRKPSRVFFMTNPIHDLKLKIKTKGERYAYI